MRPGFRVALLLPPGSVGRSRKRCPPGLGPADCRREDRRLSDECRQRGSRQSARLRLGPSCRRPGTDRHPSGISAENRASRDARGLSVRLPAQTGPQGMGDPGVSVSRHGGGSGARLGFQAAVGRIFSDLSCTSGGTAGYPKLGRLVGCDRRQPAPAQPSSKLPLR